MFQPCLKVSNSYEKTTNPGIKQVYRFFDKSGAALADLITLDDEKLEEGRNYTFFHPFSTADLFVMKASRYSCFKPLLTKKMEDGKRVSPRRSLQEIQKTSSELLAAFDRSYKRQINPHIYKVSLSEKLRNLKTDLLVSARVREEEAKDR